MGRETEVKLEDIALEADVSIVSRDFIKRSVQDKAIGNAARDAS